MISNTTRHHIIRGISLIIFLFATLLVARLTQAEVEEDRVAFVVGNANYPGLAKLDNPTNDAVAVSGELNRLGFETHLFQNMKVEDLPLLKQKLHDRLKKNTRLVFYYAGHGVQIESKNYLLPINTNFKSVEALANQSLYLGEILQTIEKARPRLSIVVLDACRDNPFGGDKSNALNKMGLARVDPPSSTVIFYATRPGGTASDGNNKNGLFTQSLLTELKKPQVTLEVIFRRVSTAVYSASKGDQEPWIEGVIREEFVVNHGKSNAASIEKPLIQIATNSAEQVNPQAAQPSLSQTAPQLLAVASVADSSHAIATRSFTYAQALERIQKDEKLGKTEGRNAYACAQEGCTTYQNWSRSLVDASILDSLKKKLTQVSEGDITLCQFDLSKNQCSHDALEFTVYNPFMLFMPKSEIRGMRILEPQVSNSGGLIFKSDLMAGTGKSSVSCTLQDSKLEFQNERVDLTFPRFGCMGVMPSTAKVTFDVLLWNQETLELLVSWRINMISWMAYGSANGIAKIKLPART